MIRVNTLLVFLLMTGPVCAVEDLEAQAEKNMEVREDLPEVPALKDPAATEKPKSESAQADKTPAEPSPAAATVDNTITAPAEIWTEPMVASPALTPEPSAIAKDYEVRQQGNNLELITPYGRKMIFGDYGFKNQHDYKFSIPLDQLRPPSDKKIEDAKLIDKNREIASVPPKDEAAKDKPVTAAAEQTLPPRVIVEYDYSDRLILEANRLYNRRKFYEASITIEELLTKRPDYPRGWVMKGSLMYVQGHRDLAKEAWKKALELDPTNLQVKQYLGRLK